MNTTNKILLPLTAIAGIIFLALKNNKGKFEKIIGTRCVRTDGGPDGKIVYDFSLTTSDNEIPSFFCKRCNPTGCSTIPYTP